MTTSLLLALPLALVWMGLTSQINFEGFIVGFVLSLTIIALFHPPRVSVQGGRLPGQIRALLLYILFLFRDIFLSGIDVARRVLSPTMPLKLGVIAVSTQDETKNPVIAALSADVITLTPGELVIEIEDNHIMYVHSLDVDLTANQGNEVQAKRLRLLRQIVGREG